MNNSAALEHLAGTDARVISDVRAALLAWFERNGRDLPWRRTRDPWRILVSEVMLQQIQVKRAIPFYESFLARFPTLASLAEAPLSEAIMVWRDLGRYRRVVQLHRTARLVVDAYGGELPSDPETLVKFPGIGPYTAGAVACFAFERDVVFADTNARRVLHRVFMGPDVPEPVVREGELLALARTLLPSGEGWRWNQALIELGAMVCTARAPRCGSCPLRDACASRPAILGLIAAEPRSEEPPVAYAGSNRFFRGRVLAALRANDPHGLSLRALAETIADHPDGQRADVATLQGIVESLRKDGLVVLSGAADVVAEARAPYGPGPPEDEGVSGTDAGDEGARVRLP